ncbi:NXN-like protein [Mya arenaria]|uniref:NXN-like protein n=1 Tax=Mya arenaria TaxID=6604 RepID=A0ABY7DEH5_MYAAR|nr:nucleoredoxin-like [Mya arenaria]WAQ95333.1 NXN-like protein [Mya arenaria]
MESGSVLQLLEGNMIKDGQPFAFTDEECIGIYFSAHWCPPCRQFTPKLKTFYNGVRSQGHKFEVVFVSADLDEESFDENLQEMPWAALRYDHSEIKDSMSEKFGLIGIPNLIIVDRQGNVITKKGRVAVQKNTVDAKLFKWT